MIVHPDEVTPRQIDKLAEAGVNVLGIHSVGGTEANESLASLVNSLKTDEFRSIIDYAVSKGLEVEYELHAAGYLLPRRLFDRHPEYFRIDEKGKRTADWNFCVSHPDALALFAKNAAKLANSLYGSTDRFYFWLDDGWDTYCHCEKCSKLTPSDQQMIAVNAMIKEIKKQKPGAKIAYLAYCNSMIPPSTVAPDKDVFLEYAPFAKYTASGDGAEKKIKQELDLLVPLLELFGGDEAKILEYWYDNSLFSGWKKPPQKFVLNERAMMSDIEAFKSLGFKNISTFACFLGDDYVKLYGEPDFMPFGRCLNL